MAADRSLTHEQASRQFSQSLTFSIRDISSLESTAASRSSLLDGLLRNRGQVYDTFSRAPTPTFKTENFTTENFTTENFTEESHVKAGTLSTNIISSRLKTKRKRHPIVRISLSHSPPPDSFIMPLPKKILPAPVSNREAEKKKTSPPKKAKVTVGAKDDKSKKRKFPSENHSSNGKASKVLKPSTVYAKKSSKANTTAKSTIDDSESSDIYSLLAIANEDDDSESLEECWGSSKQRNRNLHAHKSSKISKGAEEELRKVKHEYEKELQKLRREKKGAEEKWNYLEKKLKNEILTLKKDHEREISDTKEKLLKADRESFRLKDELDTAKTDHLILQGENEQLKQDLETAKNRSTDQEILRQNMESQETKYQEQADQIKSLTSQLTSLQTQHDRTLKEISDLKSSSPRHTIPSSPIASQNIVLPSPSPSRPSPAPSHGAPPITLNEERKLDNVRQRYIKVKKHKDTLLAVCRDLLPFFDGMKLKDWGKVGLYVERLRAAVDE